MAFQLVDIVRRVGFRQADHVHAGPHGGFQIQQAKRRAERVNAHHGFDILIHRVLQGVEHQHARGILLAQGDGVLKIKHDGVGTVDKGG